MLVYRLSQVSWDPHHGNHGVACAGLCLKRCAFADTSVGWCIQSTLILGSKVFHYQLMSQNVTSDDFMMMICGLSTGQLVKNHCCCRTGPTLEPDYLLGIAREVCYSSICLYSLDVKFLRRWKAKSSNRLPPRFAGQVLLTLFPRKGAVVVNAELMTLGTGEILQK